MIASRRAIVAAMTGFAAVMVSAGATLAQSDAAAPHGPILTRSDAAIVGVVAAASAVLVGWDRAIADAMRASPLQDAQAVRGAMSAANAYGDPGVLAAGAALWLSGHWARNDTRRLVGLRSVEAVLASGAVAGVIKGVTGRARPDQSSGNARDFVLGRGIGDRSEFQSFPSGHATAAFAFASAVDAEWARLRPGRPAWVPAVLYAAAALTGAARVYRDRHWASDVVMGSAVGFVGGRAVVRWHADRP
jgi:membrane-associated phospholipid phosphatase